MTGNKDAGRRILALLEILSKYSDENHPVSMPDLIAELAEYDQSADRKTIYQAIRVLNEFGYRVEYVRGRQSGYCLSHPFSAAEICIIRQALEEIKPLSLEDETVLFRKLNELLSRYDRKKISDQSKKNRKNGASLLNSVELLLNAIAGFHPIEYSYYDLSAERKKSYRKNRTKYRQVPYAVVLNNGWYYCICYSFRHGDFAAYRIDKMEELTVLKETADPVRFDLQSFMNASFRMYKGSPATVTAEFDRSLSNALFDQFDDRVIIQSVNEQTFTASIQTTVTPTLISWILQFYDRITIRKPAYLIEELQKIGRSINNVYGPGKESYDEGSNQTTGNPS